METGYQKVSVLRKYNSLIKQQGNEKWKQGSTAGKWAMKEILQPQSHQLGSCNGSMQNITLDRDQMIQEDFYIKHEPSSLFTIGSQLVLFSV